MGLDSELRFVVVRNGCGCQGDVLRAAGCPQIGVVGQGAVACQRLEYLSGDGTLERSEDRSDGPALGEVFP